MRWSGLRLARAVQRRTAIHAFVMLPKVRLVWIDRWTHRCLHIEVSSDVAMLIKSSLQMTTDEEHRACDLDKQSISPDFLESPPS